MVARRKATAESKAPGRIVIAGCVQIVWDSVEILPTVEMLSTAAAVAAARVKS